MRDIEDLKYLVEEVQDYPTKGVSYKDITRLIEDGEAIHRAVEILSSLLEGIEYSKILCAEARGFVVGSALAHKEIKGIVLARKPGKLPRETIATRYELEYGVDSLEIHSDSILPGEKVLVVDDLLASGGTARAMCDLAEKSRAEVSGIAFLIELSYLDGRESLYGFPVFSLIQYDS